MHDHHAMSLDSCIVPMILLNYVMTSQANLITEYIHGPCADSIIIENCNSVGEGYDLGYRNVRFASQESTNMETDDGYPRNIPRTVCKVYT